MSPSDGHFRVRLENTWFDVDASVITEPNRAARTMVALANWCSDLNQVLYAGKHDLGLQRDAARNSIFVLERKVGSIPPTAPLQHEFPGSGLVARRVQVLQSVLCDPEGFLYYSHNIFLMEITTERSSMEITTDQSFCGECEVVIGYDDIGDRELLTQEFDL
jgi:hypothetical protein